MTEPKVPTLGPGTPLGPAPDDPAPRRPDASALDPAALAPGMLLTTDTEAYFLLRQIGEGGTARAFVAIPVRTARFADPDASVFLPHPAPEIGVTRVVPETADILTTIEHQTLTSVLKVATIPPTHPMFEGITARMQMEAHGYGALDDPRAPRLYGAGRSPLPYLALEFIRGPTLRETIAEVPAPARMPWQRALRIALQLCGAAHVLHGRGIIHRDLKPENVIMARPEGLGAYPRIIDLGVMKYCTYPGIEGLLAGVAPADRNITRLFGGLPVTPGYGAPEQYDPDAAVTPAADVYALGIIAYELLMGHPPYTGSFPGILRTMQQPLPLLGHRELRRDTLAEAHRVLARAVAWEASDRYPTALAFAAALRDAFTHEGDHPSAARAATGTTPVTHGRSTPRTTPVTVRRTPVTSAVRRAPASRMRAAALVAIGMLLGFLATFAAIELRTVPPDVVPPPPAATAPMVIPTAPPIRIAPAAKRIRPPAKRPAPRHDGRTTRPHDRPRAPGSR